MALRTKTGGGYGVGFPFLAVTVKASARLIRFKYSILVHARLSF